MLFIYYLRLFEHPEWSIETVGAYFQIFNLKKFCQIHRWLENAFHLLSSIIRISCAIDRGSIRYWRAFLNFQKTIEYAEEDYSKEGLKFAIARYYRYSDRLAISIYDLEKVRLQISSKSGKIEIVAWWLGRLWNKGGTWCILQALATLWILSFYRVYLIKILALAYVWSRLFFSFFFRQFVPFPP